MTRHRPKLVVFGLLASGAFMALAVQHLRLADVRQAYKEVELLPWVPVAVL